jgi:hypothetical protein
MVQRGSRAARLFGNALVKGVPKLLTGLSVLGTAAMLWVGGGILLHGLEELHLIEAVPHAVHDAAHQLAGGSGALEWVLNALASAVAGLIVGLPIAGALMLWHRRNKPATAAH